MLKDEIQEIRIPKESIADDSVLLLKWYKESGSKVNKGDLISSCETSKAIFDVEAPIDGYLFYQYRVGEEIPVGNLLAIISKESSFSFDLYNKKEIEVHQKLEDKIKFSKKALELIEKNNVKKENFSDYTMVTKEDVLNYLNQNLNNKTNILNNNIMKSNNQELIVIGGGGHAKMCIDIINQMGIYKIIGIIDKVSKIGAKISGIPIIGRDKDLVELYNKGVKLAVNGLGMILNQNKRAKIFRKLKQIGFFIPNIVHPKASIEPSAILGEGNQIMANAIIGSYVKIKNNCIINSGAIISHDSILENNVHVAPGAILAGDVHIGENTLIGMGTTIYLSLNIGENVIIYNNCSITRNIPNNKIIKK